MNTMRMMTTALAFCLLVLAAVPAIADVEIPEEWNGIWELGIAIYDCDTNVLLFATTNLDTICPGSVFEDPDPGSASIECTGSATATSYTTHCEGSEEVDPGCIANFVYDVSGTRNGDTYTSIATFNTTYTGDCGFFPDSCQRTEITGTRISTDPAPCEISPVESRPWATVKSYYR